MIVFLFLGGGNGNSGATTGFGGGRGGKGGDNADGGAGDTGFVLVEWIEQMEERYLGNILKYCFSASKYDWTQDRAFFERYPEFKECVEQSSMVQGIKNIENLLKIS